MPNSRKIFIIDTSVLLYDKTSIHSFPENDVIIPLVVLDELDKFKDYSGLLGESARYVNRYLDDLRKFGNLHTGIKVTSCDQTIRVVHCNDKIPIDFDGNSADNKILSVGLFLKEKEENRQIIIITKDINLRVKCDALGLLAEDYNKDRIVETRSKIYKGIRSVEMPDEMIDDFYKSKSIDSSILPHTDLEQNEFIYAKNKSFLGIHKSGCIKALSLETNVAIKVKPRNKEQMAAMHLLLDPEIQLVTLIGIAGSGKTYLTLAAALSSLFDKRYEKIIITRVMQPVGKEIGFLPGTIDEKVEPWLSPIKDNFRNVFKDHDLSYYETMRNKGEIEIAPLSFIRGRTFDDSFLIVDEAQNASVHELKTIITRLGKNSKIILMGDIEQIDTPYLDSLSNGLTVVVEKFKGEKLSGHMTLMKGERSDVATLATKLL